MLQGARLLPPGPQMGAQGGRSEISGGPRALLGPRSEKMGPWGGLWAARGRFGGPRGDFEIVKKPVVFTMFGALGPPRDPKGGQKVVKKAPSDASQD